MAHYLTFPSETVLSCIEYSIRWKQTKPMAKDSFVHSRMTRSELHSRSYLSWLVYVASRHILMKLLAPGNTFQAARMYNRRRNEIEIYFNAHSEQQVIKHSKQNIYFLLSLPPWGTPKCQRITDSLNFQ